MCEQDAHRCKNRLNFSCKRIFILPWDVTTNGLFFFLLNFNFHSPMAISGTQDYNLTRFSPHIQYRTLGETRSSTFYFFRANDISLFFRFISGFYIYGPLYDHSNGQFMPISLTLYDHSNGQWTLKCYYQTSPPTIIAMPKQKSKAFAKYCQKNIN